MDAHMARILTVGHSPDPDDAFMFYGLASGKVKIDDFEISHILGDIQSLNMRAMKGELEVTAISAHAFPYVRDHYWIMATGASMGEGYGPVLVSKRFSSLEELRGKRIATPGPLTTATLLLKIFTEEISSVDIPFDRIMDAVTDGTVDAGVLIHEGQITYGSQGFTKILDFGEVWDKETGGLPLPLGLDVVRKDLGEKTARRISTGLKESIHYGYTHQDESIPYALQWGRGISRDLGEKFVKMYVSDLTIDMGEKGRKGLRRLFELACEKKLIPVLPEIVLY
jgi:1,4-dihydroxy-6-naphthoate synthase